MADLRIEKPEDLESALNSILAELRELRAETLVSKVLIHHIIGRLVRKAEDPAKYFQDIRTSSRENIEKRLRFTYGDPEIGEKVRADALEKHEQMFEELAKRLDLRDQTTTH